MNLFEFIHSNITYILSNHLISVSALVILIYLLFKKPKAFIVIFLSAIAAAGIVNIFSTLLSLGLEHKPIPFIE